MPGLLLYVQTTAPTTGLSFDWDSLIPLAVATVGYLGVKAVKRSSSIKRVEQVDNSVLGRFEELQGRVGKLETDLQRAFDEIRRLKKREAQLEGKVSVKDEEIISLRIANGDLREELETLYDEAAGDG